MKLGLKIKADVVAAQIQRPASDWNWQQFRFARNACSPSAPPVQLHLYGIPSAFAVFLGVTSL